MSNGSSSKITEIVSEEDSSDIGLQEKVNLEGLDHENEAIDDVSIKKFRKLNSIVIIKYWIIDGIFFSGFIYTFNYTAK